MDQGILDTQLFLTVILGLYRENIKTAFNQMNENLNETSIQNILTVPLSIILSVCAL